MSRRGIVHLSTVHHSRDNRIYNKEVCALVEAGFDTTLVICADADEASPVPLVALPRPRGRVERLVGTQARAWRALSRLRPGLVHIHDPELVPLAWAWARTHGARCVYDAHEDLVDQMESKDYLPWWARVPAEAYARLLTGWADRGMDAVVAATAPVASRFTASRAVVVHNYPWLREFATEPAPVPGRLVYVGDLSEERGLSFMIDVTRRVRARLPAAHLVLAGRLLDDARPAASAFDDDLVTHLGLLHPADVPAVLSSAQVGLVLLAPLPNYTESLPTKLFEYLGAGVPFVASDFPAWREMFGPLDAGIFVDSRDAAATAEAVATLLEAPKECARLGANGRAAVRDEFSFEREVPALVALVERLGVTRGRRPSDT